MTESYFDDYFDHHISSSLVQSNKEETAPLTELQQQLAKRKDSTASGMMHHQLLPLTSHYPSEYTLFTQGSLCLHILSLV